MYLPMKLLSENEKRKEIVEEGFLDCGATGKFINQNYTKTKQLETNLYKKPIQIFNVDGTPNKQGTIRSYMDLDIEEHGQTRREQLMVTGLGKQIIILAYTWLRETNPIIGWEKGTLDQTGKEITKGRKINQDTHYHH
jgi:hypothetical protein